MCVWERWRRVANDERGKGCGERKRERYSIEVYQRSDRVMEGGIQRVEE